MLQENALTGALFLLGILANSWLMFAGALLGVAVGTISAMLLKYPEKEIKSGLYGFNAALVGIAMFFFLVPGPESALLAVAGSILSTIIMNFMLRRKLPAYTFPFVLSAWVALALASATGFIAFQAQPAPTAQLDIISALSMGFSQVMFQANILTGLLFLAGILANSRPSALYALLGSIAGAAVALLISFPLGLISIGIYGYNGVLCGIAFSGNKKHAPVLALAAIVLSVLLVAAFSAISVPALTAPFVFSTWIVLALGKKL